MFDPHSDAVKVQYGYAVLDDRDAYTGVVKLSPQHPFRSRDLRLHALTFLDDMSCLPTSRHALAAQV